MAEAGRQRKNILALGWTSGFPTDLQKMCHRGVFLAINYFFSPDSLFLQEVGYQHGKTVFNVWCRSGVLDKMLKDRQETCKSKTDVSVGFKCAVLRELLAARRVGYCPQTARGYEGERPIALNPCCEHTCIT